MTIQRLKLLALAAVLSVVVSSGSTAEAVLVYGLTDENDLLLFDSANPVDLFSGGAIQGLQGQDLLGIDVRPANGQIYGVGNLGGIFQINPNTFQATLVSSLPISTLGGTRYGIDFNPVADRLRMVSNTDQSLAVNVDTGTFVVNGTLFYGAPNPPDAIGDNPSVSSSAYTNSVRPAPGGTVLFGIDSRSTEDRLVTQNTSTGALTVVGPLGFPLNVNISNVSGFDIYFDTLLQQDVGLAALQLNTGGISQLYRINLTTGAATLIDDIGGGDLLDGLAVANPIPEPGTIALGLVGAMAMGLIVVRRRRA